MLVYTSGGRNHTTQTYGLWCHLSVEAFQRFLANTGYTGRAVAVLAPCSDWVNRLCVVHYVNYEYSLAHLHHTPVITVWCGRQGDSRKKVFKKDAAALACSNSRPAELKNSITCSHPSREVVWFLPFPSLEDSCYPCCPVWCCQPQCPPQQRAALLQLPLLQRRPAVLRHQSKCSLNSVRNSLHFS